MQNLYPSWKICKKNKKISFHRKSSLKLKHESRSDIKKTEG